MTSHQDNESARQRAIVEQLRNSGVSKAQPEKLELGNEVAAYLNKLSDERNKHDT